jgi:mediator of RNA polymerase II transcription subunit 27
MADHSSKLDIVQATAALKSLRSLRNNVGTLFHSLTEGIGLQSGQDSKESRFVAELQQQLVTVQSGVKYVLQKFQYLFVFEDIFKLFLGNSKKL